DDHGHGVPADQALDAPLDVAVAGEGRLLAGGDGVDVGGVGGEGQLDALADGLVLQLGQQVAGPVGALRLEDRVERVEPLARLGNVDVPIPPDDLITLHCHAPFPLRAG